MRITSILCAQHIGRGFKNLWKIQRQRKILDYGVRAELEANGIKITDALEVAGLKPLIQDPVPDDVKSAPILLKREEKLRANPDWHDESCLVYNDHSFLLAGCDQAVNLTRMTLVSDSSLPEKLEAFKVLVDEDLHTKLRSDILSAHAIDAKQEKLPRAIDLAKPGWKHPREYGLTRRRRNELLMSKLFHTCDAALARTGAVDVLSNQVVNYVRVKDYLDASDQQLLFDVTVSKMLCAKKPLQPYADSEAAAELLSRPMPSIYPLSPTVTIYPSNIYRLEHFFPVKVGAPYAHPNMVLFGLNMPFIKYNASQLQARLLVHAFGAAASYARQRYGEEAVELPEPVVLNCVHTDSQKFLFACIQVHSLDLSGPQQSRNLAWMTPEMSLFQKCGYVDSRPVLEGYNPQVVETLLAMYHSQLSARSSTPN